MSRIVTTGRRHTRSTSSVASTAGVIAERSTGSIQRSAPGMVMPVALAGRYPKASTVVRASNSQSNQEAGSSASSAHASASYHGSTDVPAPRTPGQAGRTQPYQHRDAATAMREPRARARITPGEPEPGAEPADQDPAARWPAPNPRAARQTRLPGRQAASEEAAASQATTSRNAHPIDCPALCP